MSALRMFMPITKVDAARRLVYGLATAEAPDRAGEICDYASTKPLYEKWSQEIARSSGGKSLGNLRSMHGPVAAGKVTQIEFNDDDRQIEICAKVVDDAEWSKVVEGVYTGFSQGGAYVRRWTDEDGLTRYTADPTEISLVDLPCLPQARFELIKADGARELRPFGLDAQARALLETLGRIEAAFEADETAFIFSPRDLRAFCGEVDETVRALLDRCEDARKDAAPADDGEDEDHDDEPMSRSAPAPAPDSGRRLEKRFDELSRAIADVLARVKTIESQPAPMPFGGRPRVVAKHEDGTRESDRLETLLDDPGQLSILAIKLAHRNGRAPLR